MYNTSISRNESRTIKKLLKKSLATWVHVLELTYPDKKFLKKIRFLTRKNGRKYCDLIVNIFHDNYRSNVNPGKVPVLNLEKSNQMGFFMKVLCCMNLVIC